MTPGRRRLVVAVAALALLVGCTSRGAQRHESSPAASPDQPAAGATAARSFRSVRDYRATPVPVRLEIPRIGVSSSLDRLGRAPDGTVEEPGRWEVPGWYEPGPRPGDPGSAVILGHVDSKRGPAVFFRLRELRRGDEVRVTRADGASVRFVVQRTASYDKQRFPTDAVYYPTLTSMLQLVTCGGQFDVTTGHYRSNIIVFATMRP
jgi:sortase (surface protein transpeptidase)